MKRITEQVWSLIEKHADRGFVDMKGLERDCRDLPFDGEDIDTTIEELCDGRLVHMLDGQIVIVRPYRCPDCGRNVLLFSEHIDECLWWQRQRARWRELAEEYND
jgi:hypothetical protein